MDKWLVQGLMEIAQLSWALEPCPPTLPSSLSTAKQPWPTLAVSPSSLQIGCPRSHRPMDKEALEETWEEMDARI